MNPLNKEITAAVIYCNFTSSMTPSMSEGLHMSGKLNNLSLDVNYVKPLFRSDETVETISVKMQAVK